jgi:predicted Zn-dependent peptidase
VTSYSDAGHLTVYAGTGLESVDEVLRLTLEEFRRMIDEPVSAEELRRAKDHIKGSLLLSLENTGSRMSHLARQELYFGRQIDLAETLAGIEAVSPEDVRRVSEVLLGQPLTLSVLGNLQGYRPRSSRLRA